MINIVKNPQLTATAVRLYNMRKICNFSICMILNIMKIARSTLYRWIHMYNSNKLSFIDDPKAPIEKKPLKGRPKVFTEACINYILEYVKGNPQFNFKLLRRKISNIFNVKISRSYLYYILKKYNIVRMKVNVNKYPHSDAKFNDSKNKLKKEMISVKKNFIAIDETSIDVTISSNYGFAKKGTKCVIKNKRKRKRFTVIMAITKKRILDYKIVSGSCNGELFMNFINNDILQGWKRF